MSSTDQAFERIYERHHRPVLAYCLRRTSRPEAYEAANEVFTVAWRRAADMPSHSEALPWLYAVARRVLGHQRRSVARRARLAAKAVATAPVTSYGPEAVVLQQYEHAAVRNAVDRLKADDREMLLLSAWEGLTHAEIAEAMGLTLATVDKRLSRAKERLRRQFEAVRSSHRPPMNTARGGDAS